MYYFQLHGVEIRCDSAAELYAAIGGNECQSSVTNFEPLEQAIDEHLEHENGNGRSRPDIAAIWAKARRMAKREGISVPEARSRILAKK